MMLMKKLFIYRTMSSDVFIKYSLPLMHAMYKVFGTRVTNKLVQSSAGGVFTSGE